MTQYVFCSKKIQQRSGLIDVKGSVAKWICRYNLLKWVLHEAKVVIAHSLVCMSYLIQTIENNWCSFRWLSKLFTQAAKFLCREHEQRCQQTQWHEVAKYNNKKYVKIQFDLLDVNIHAEKQSEALHIWKTVCQPNSRLWSPSGIRASTLWHEIGQWHPHLLLGLLN